MANMPEEEIELSWRVILEVFYLRWVGLGKPDGENDALRVLNAAQVKNFRAYVSSLFTFARSVLILVCRLLHRPTSPCRRLSASAIVTAAPPSVRNWNERGVVIGTPKMAMTTTIQWTGTCETRTTFRILLTAFRNHSPGTYLTSLNRCQYRRTQCQLYGSSISISSSTRTILVQLASAPRRRLCWRTARCETFRKPYTRHWNSRVLWRLVPLFYTALILTSSRALG